MYLFALASRACLMLQFRRQQIIHGVQVEHRRVVIAPFGVTVNTDGAHLRQLRIIPPTETAPCCPMCSFGHLPPHPYISIKASRDPVVRIEAILHQDTARLGWVQSP